MSEKNLSGFIIPMTVLAYRVQNGAKRVPALNPNFKAARAFALGKDVTPDAFNSSLELQEGIHLHFILPSVLKHGIEQVDGNGNKTFKYPYVPDKYIVTRMYVDENKKIINDCNIVDSSFISIENNGNCVTFPYEDEAKYRYLGRQYSGLKKDSGIDINEGNEDHISELFAVGPGDPLFNAYYPNCRGVFGYYDNLEGVPENAVLTYSVIGYFSNSNHDLFAGVKKENLENFLSEHNLSAEAVLDDTCYGNSLLFGEVCGIDLSKKNPLPEGVINVGIGRTSAEALSAAIAKKYSHDKTTERTLTMIQYDMADEVMQIDGNFKIDDSIHSYGFTSSDSFEKKYEVKFPKDTEFDDPSNEVLLTYAKLSEEQRKTSKLRRELEFKKNTLYYLWEMYIKSLEPYSTEHGPLATKINETRKEIENLRKEINDNKENIFNNKMNSLYATIKKTTKNFDKISIQEVPAKPFYYPKDPALMLFGSGMKRTYAFGEDGRFEDDNTLFCLTSPLTNTPADAEYQKILGLISNKNFITEINIEKYSSFLVMTAMLDENILRAIDKKSNITRKYSQVMLNNNPNEEVILFMEWESVFHNNYTNSAPSSSSFIYGDTDYIYRGSKTENERWALGTSVLTPHGVCNLGDKLDKYIKSHPDGDWEKSIDELEKEAEDIKNTPVISQNLGGFTINLAALKYVFQKPIETNNLKTDNITNLVYECLYTNSTSLETEPERLAVVEGSDVIPLREGFLDIKRLSMVSTFGNSRSVIDGEKNTSEGIRCLSENLCQDIDSPNTNNDCFLTLALTTPARLSPYFVSVVNKSIPSCSLPGSSPIQAIIMPDMLNKNLDIFDNKGELIGIIKKTYKTIENKNGKYKIATGSFVQVPSYSGSIKNTPIEAFINLLTDDKSYTKDSSYLSELLKVIDTKLNNTIPMYQKDMIFGRVLVLAEMNVELEYFGGTEFSKKADSVKNLNDKGLFAQNFPVMIGDINRVTDGVICGFYGDENQIRNDNVANDFKNGFAAFGYNTQNNKFLKAPHPTVSGEKIAKVTLLMDPSLSVTLSTGILPVEQIQIDASHTDFSQMNLKQAEMNTLISEIDRIQLPDFTDGENFTRKHPVLPKKTTGEDNEYESIKVVKAEPTIGTIGNLFITDGFLVKENKKGE